MGWRPSCWEEHRWYPFHQMKASLRNQEEWFGCLNIAKLGLGAVLTAEWDVKLSHSKSLADHSAGECETSKSLLNESQGRRGGWYHRLHSSSQHGHLAKHKNENSAKTHGGLCRWEIENEIPQAAQEQNKHFKMCYGDLMGARSLLRF